MLEAHLLGGRHPPQPQLQAMHIEGKPLPFFGCGATDEEPHTGPIRFATPELKVDFLHQFQKLEAAARQDDYALSDDDKATPNSSITYSAERNLRIADHVMQMICHDWEPGLPLPRSYPQLGLAWPQVKLSVVATRRAALLTRRLGRLLDLMTWVALGSARLLLLAYRRRRRRTCFMDCTVKYALDADLGRK